MHAHAIPPSFPDLEERWPWGHWPTVERHSADSAEVFIGARSYRRIDDRCWSPERRTADMDTENVAVQVISPAPITLCYLGPAEGATELAAHQNDFMADLAAARPDRFRVLGTVPLQDPDAAVAELRRSMARPGFVGVEIGTRVDDRELSHPDFDSFFEVASELNAVVFIHPVDSMLDVRIKNTAISFACGMPSETGLAAADLITSGALERRPPARICLAHGAGTLPLLLPRLDRVAAINNPSIRREQLPSALARSYFCDSLTYDPDSLRMTVERFGDAHVVVGTDYPFVAREAPAGAVLAAAGGAISVDLRSAISWQNALRLMEQA